MFDKHGAWELFRVRGTGAMTLALERAHATATVFGPGAVVAPVELHHYYADAERSQLRHYDGWQGTRLSRLVMSRRPPDCYWRRARLSS